LYQSIFFLNKLRMAEMLPALKSGPLAKISGVLRKVFALVF
jgi:hypothetical protein